MYVYMCMCVCAVILSLKFEPLKITAREIPSPRQPYKYGQVFKCLVQDYER